MYYSSVGCVVSPALDVRRAQLQHLQENSNVVMHSSMFGPRVRGGAGYPREIDSASFSLGGDFDIRVLPWGREFDIATTCFGQKAIPRGGNLTFSRCPGVGNLTLALVKMSNSPGSGRPPPPTPHPGA